MRKRSPPSGPLGIDDALLARVEKQAWFHRYPRGWPFLLFLITLLGIALSVIAIERSNRQARAAELDRNATEIASGLQRRASDNIAMLRAAAAMFSFREITPLQFQRFAADFYNRGQYRGALGIGWAPLITPAEIDNLEARVRTDGNAAFTVHPRPDPTDHATRVLAPVIDVMPENAATRPAVGFDMMSEPIRRIAIRQAIRLQQPVATGRIRLITPNGGKPQIGFLIYVPVFRDTADDRRVTAMVYSPIRAEAFLASAAELYRHRGVEIALYDSAAISDNLLTLRAVPGDTGATLDRQITVANRNWILRVSAKRTGSLTTLSRITLVFGTLFALLVMYTARVITRRAVEDRQVLEALRRQETIRTQLTRELNHRVKNTLANVLSIVSLTRRRATDLDEFAEGLTARVRALSATHDLLAQSDWTDAPIAEIVRSELAPYLQDDDGHVVMSGPDISLAPNDALSLGLAVHELATNAAKYGALSTPDGRISVTWRNLSADLAEVHWRESGGPEVQVPRKRGFGRDLIEKIVAHELRSKVELSFEPEGVQCRLQVPVRRIGDFAIRSDRAAS